MWIMVALGSGLLAVSPIGCALGTVFINGTVKPMLIPASEIDAIAADLIGRFRDPKGAALIEEYAAWYRSDNFAQGKWRRVRKRIEKSISPLVGEMSRSDRGG